MIFSVFLLVLVLILVYNLSFSLFNYFRGYPPSLSSTNIAVENIFKIYNFTKEDRVADLGSGHGKVIRKLYKNNVSVDGFELNPVLYLTTRLTNIFNKNIKIYRKDFIKEDLSKYTILTAYLSNDLMDLLEAKIKEEYMSDLVVIANKFPFKGIKYDKKLGDIYLYKF